MQNRKEIRKHTQIVVWFTVMLRHYGEVHRALQVPHDRDRVAAAECLRKLCLFIRPSKLERAQVHLVLAAPRLVLQSAECWLLCTSFLLNSLLYRLYATTRNSSGEMIRKLSVIRSRKRSHFLVTVRLRKRRIADLNCAKVS